MQTLFYNGPVITMETADPAEALLIEDDAIRAAGTLTEAERLAEANVHRVDLEGHTLMPAFIDPHSHFAAAANSFLQASLSQAKCFEDIVKEIQRYIKENKIAPGEWIRAGGYDHNFLAEKRHPDASVLDLAAPDNPLMISHASGHMGAFNSRAMEILNTPDRENAVPGGRIAVKDGKPTGYMEENAFFESQQKVPAPGGQDFTAAFDKAQKWYFSNGITFAQEGMFIDKLIPFYQGMLSAGALRLDVVGYAPFDGAQEVEEAFKNLSGVSRLRIGGYKMFLDGSPQGRTAWLRRPYSGSADYCGYGTLDDDTVYGYICKAVKENKQLLAHCNGDAACEQYIAMAEKAERAGYDVAKIRPVMIHAQLLGRDQLSRVKRAGIIPSFFVAHVYHWGDVHLENFGRERACAISPAASALREGIRFTFHQDTPVIPPNMLETVWCAANRVTKGGRILGKDERIPVYEALKAVTSNAAYQYFEENNRGTLCPGKKADMIILSRNPLEIPRENIRDIHVLATYKDGKKVM